MYVVFRVTCVCVYQLFVVARPFVLYLTLSWGSGQAAARQRPRSGSGQAGMARTAVAPAGNEAAAGTRIGLSGTHLVRALLLTPWGFWLLSPFVLRHVHIQPAMFSAPVPIVFTSAGFRLTLSLIAMGAVALIFSHALEAGRRCKLPTLKHASSSASDASTARLAGLRGCFSLHLHARSMLVWDAYDCVETTIISACLSGGFIGARNIELGLNAETGIYGIVMFVLPFAVALIMKRVLSGITDVQRERMPAFVMGTAVPTLALALCFLLYLMLVYANAGLSYPYFGWTEELMAVMLATGNNSRIQCDDEAAFWDIFRLPYTFEDGFTYDCMEPRHGRSPGPLCGYRSWKDLCQAFRFSFVSLSTGRIFIRGLIFTVLVFAIIFIVLVGSGRIARTIDGEIDFKRLQAPHILLILGLTTVSFFISLNFLSVFFLQAPLVMQGQALADPLAGCGPDSFCWFLVSSRTSVWVMVAPFVLLPIDTLKRVLSRYGNRKRTYFLSYKQNDGNDGAVQMLANLLGTGSVWFDKYATDRSETGMVNGVTSQDIFVAILSPNYFQSKFCCLEMRTALKMGKPVLVVWNQSKSTVQTALGWVQALPQFELAILLESEPPVLKPNPLS